MIKFGLSLPLSYDIKQLLELTWKAEDVGFDYVFMPDHIVSLDGKQPLNVWSVLNVLAAYTTRIGLGSMVANVYRQHPSTLRQQVYTLKQAVHNRKLIIGLGAGMKFDCEPFAILQTHPLTRMRESYHQLGDLGVDVVMGAYGPKMKSLASWTQGWVSRHALSPEEFGKECNEIKAFEFEMNNSPDFLYIADVPVSHTIEPWLCKSLAYRYLLQTKYRNAVFNQATANNIEVDSATVPRSVIEDFSAVGDTGTIIKMLESYVSYGANTFSIRYYGKDLERFGEVIDYFKNQ